MIFIAKLTHFAKLRWWRVRVLSGVTGEDEEILLADLHNRYEAGLKTISTDANLVDELVRFQLGFNFAK